MIQLFCMVWTSICLAETIELEINGKDSDRYLLFVSTFSNFLFPFFQHDLVPAFFVLTFVNIVGTFPFYLLQKVNGVYGFLKSLTYVGFVIWLVSN